jgi:tRNA/tmRNA/rRNA uracil-C5-methylase (TrmA/RlmC/RlmD family)
LTLCSPIRRGAGSAHWSPRLGDFKRLVLVSCHLPSFVRDAKNLTERGWSVKRIVPFDMFAQTSYVEIISLFERNG